MERTIFESEHDEFRQAFRAWVDNEIVPNDLEWNEAGIVPRELFADAGSHGFLAFDVPEEFGGGGMPDFRFNAIAAEEIQMAGVGASGLGLTLHNDITIPYFLKYCTEERRQFIAL